MSGRENRAFQRHPRDFRVEYSVLSGAGELAVIPARTLDFSQSGARIQTARQLKCGDSLSVRFEVPELNQDGELTREGRNDYRRTVMMCFGEVRWVDRLDGEDLFAAGILFRHLSLVERAYLRRLLALELESGGNGPVQPPSLS